MVSEINYAFGLDYEAWTALAECVFADNSYRGGDRIGGPKWADGERSTSRGSRKRDWMP